MTLVVIGIDGMDWDFVNRFKNDLTFFGELLDKGLGRRLYIDVRPDTGPSWICAFSGLTPRETGIDHPFVYLENIRGLPKHKELVPRMKELIAKRVFLWDRFEHPWVLGIPVCFPPININAELKDWLPVILPTTPDEARKSITLMTEMLKEALKKEYDLYCMVYGAIDKIQHIAKDDRTIFEFYSLIDSCLEELELGERNWVILSDHGRPLPRSHSRNGVIFSNIAPLPEKMTQVHSWLVRNS